MENIMKNLSKVALALAGVAGLALSAESAQAQLVLNGAGSSAGRLFAGTTPAALCAAAPTPLLFVSNEGTPNKYEWQCTINGVPNSRVRYSATASEDGYVKQAVGVAGTAVYLNTAGCPAGVATTILGKTVLKSVCPAGTPTQPLTVHWGGADVQAGSLHQDRRPGSPGDFVTPPSTNGLTTTGTVLVPFSIVVGGGVKNGTGGTLTNLPREEIRQLVAGTVANWEDLGYVGGPVVRCQRTAGSGTLAALDEILIQSPYLPGTTFPGTSNASSSNMIACINGNAASIGYLDSDSAIAANFPNGGHAVAFGGESGSGGNALRCGRYTYWATWNFITRSGLAVQQPPINAIPGTAAAIQDLGDAMIVNNPLPAFWVSLDDSFVDKNADRGPHRWPSQVNGNGVNISTVCN
jgi:hypothetical protein